jgi:uncharacterized membrane protein YqgA involved in biofilm formation
MYMAKVDTGESVKPLIAMLFVTAITLFFLAKTAFFGSMKKGDNTDAYTKIMIGSVAGTLIMYKIVNYIT